jgi:hypothetical protein
VVIGLPASLAMSETLIMGSSRTGSKQAPPEWLATQTVRATSGDGATVRARVALDAPDPDTRAFINSKSEQVKLLMQIGVSEYERQDGSQADDVQGLADELRARLNNFLVASRVPPVRDLVIQDLLFGKP